MRTLASASRDWQILQSFEDVQAFRDHLNRRAAESGELDLRSIYWKTFLLFDTVDKSQWLRRLADSRSAYGSLRGHLLRTIDRSDESSIAEDPLNDDVKRQWNDLRTDEALRQEILQDVERCMPDNTYFRQSHIHLMMLDVLFIYCKLNPDVSYRQGMHELLAPVLWVVQCDAIEDGTESPRDFLLSQLLDARFIEHDAFTLFSLVMQSAKGFYEHKVYSRGATSSAGRTLENPIIGMTSRLFDNMLPHLDPELSGHLSKIDLVPQVFLIRWTRLLFGREFPFEQVLSIWDSFFANDPRLDSVETMCLVMLLRIRFDLLEADHNDVLKLLLHYPACSNDVSAAGLVRDAVKLRALPTPKVAAELTHHYTGQMPNISTTLPDPDSFVLNDNPPTANDTQGSPRNFEAVLQNAAKNVLTQSERWGLNKAFRDAVDEVRRGVKDIQSIPTPTAPRVRHGRLQSRSSVSSASGRRPELELKLVKQQNRNEQLARMLKSATDQLWECQRVLSDLRGPEAEEIAQLGMSIARVGFVQVYLEDPSVPLAPEEIAPGKTSGVHDDGNALMSPSVDTGVARPPIASGAAAAPSALPDLRLPEAQEQSEAIGAPDPTPSSKMADTAPPARPVTPFDPQTSRPSLAQSSFSWMLGQDEGNDVPGSSTRQGGAATSPVVAGSAASSATRPRSRGFLFGDDLEQDGGDAGLERGVDGNGWTPTRRKGGNKDRRINKRGATAGRASIGGDDDGRDGFDLSDLRSGGRS